METQDEFIASSKDLTQIVKGKRTKRHRSSSPHTAAATVTSSSSSGCGRERERNMIDSTDVSDEYYGSVSSPASSCEVYQSTEEEEDMAYCLILLAQGKGKSQPFDCDYDKNSCRVGKIVSRKFFDVSSSATTATNKAGFFVYECKTCNRSFPSFQALGGHRASHKKHKSAVSDQEKKVNFTVEDHDFDFDSQSINKHNNLNLNLNQKQQQQQNPPNFSLQISATKGNNNKSKIHECSICGSEFTSGQALGGHMRRHRANNGGNNNNIDNQLMISAIDHQLKPRNILALDLNLPAPEDEHLHREPKFQFPSTQQALVFSAPPLVDCYY